MMVPGKLMRDAMDKAEEMIGMTPCEHKIGFCTDPYERFLEYQAPERRWKPWLLGLLAKTKSEEGAMMLEAILIYELERSGLNIHRNYNYTIKKNYGGEGPITQSPIEAPEPHFVYIALKPLPPQTPHERRMAAFVQRAASAQAAASADAAASAQAEASDLWANAGPRAREIVESEIATWPRMLDEEFNERPVQLLQDVSNEGEEEEPLSMDF